MSNDDLQKDEGKHYREAADKVWELAKEYEEKGLFELAGELKNIVTQIHFLANEKQGGNI